MVNAPTTIHVEPGSALDRALTESNNRPVELVRAGVHYRVTRIEDSIERDAIKTAQEDNLWADYDPRQVQKRLRASRRVLHGVDRTQLVRDLADQRSQQSDGRPE